MLHSLVAHIAFVCITVCLRSQRLVSEGRVALLSSFIPPLPILLSVNTKFWSVRNATLGRYGTLTKLLFSTSAHPYLHWVPPGLAATLSGVAVLYPHLPLCYCLVHRWGWYIETGAWVWATCPWAGWISPWPLCCCILHCGHTIPSSSTYSRGQLRMLNAFTWSSPITQLPTSRMMIHRLSMRRCCQFW